MMGDQGSEFPEVQGGGSLILAWQIKGKKVLVVGGGEVRDLCAARIDSFSANNKLLTSRSQLAVSSTASTPTPSSPSSLLPRA